jgi:hypothetical protein
MSSPGAPLPSVSSVLKWARGQVEPVGQNPASNKRLIAAVDEETLPAPLTNATIQRAIQELPQGACVALESCLTALKVKPRPAPVRFSISEMMVRVALDCARRFVALQPANMLCVCASVPVCVKNMCAVQEIIRFGVLGVCAIAHVAKCRAGSSIPAESNDTQRAGSPVCGTTWSRES